VIPTCLAGVNGQYSERPGAVPDSQDLLPKFATAVTSIGVIFPEFSCLILSSISVYLLMDDVVDLPQLCNARRLHFFKSIFHQVAEKSVAKVLSSYANGRYY
jgi:hypothetical protein